MSGDCGMCGGVYASAVRETESVSRRESFERERERKRKIDRERENRESFERQRSR